MPLPFQQMLAGGIPVIGAIDPTKIVTGAGKVVQSTPAGVQQVLDGIASGAQVQGQGAKKRSKA